ncbi:hypothetical protein CDV36_016595 [Fusarium kuroshium]|uniref:Uncharacterized protein n=1 Tax=Fusarium kuroshium TaxID=2010991 RepID=A0A3M2QLG3_9HYPO|nr:hypothetical protein CDV36_016595 [Fusarium kuroshium]
MRRTTACCPSGSLSTRGWRQAYRTRGPGEAEVASGCRNRRRDSSMHARSADAARDERGSSAGSADRSKISGVSLSFSSVETSASSARTREIIDPAPQRGRVVGRRQLVQGRATAPA